MHNDCMGLYGNLSEGINYITFVEIFLDKLIILQSNSSKRTHRELPSSEAMLSGICLPAF